MLCLTHSRYDALTHMVGGVTQMALNLTWDVWHALKCGASGGHTHPLIGNALNVTYDGVTHLTHGVVALLTWQLGHLATCRCWRYVGANVSMLNHVVVVAVDEGRRWHIITLLEDQR